MTRLLLGVPLLGLCLVGCAPGVTAARGAGQAVRVAPAVLPLIYHLSGGAVRGGEVTVQGRSLGGPQTYRVRVGADAEGRGGVLIPPAAVRSWTADQIVFTLPQNAPLGGGWLFVETPAGERGSGLPLSVGS